MKIAMIGTGGFAHYHLEMLNSEPDVTLVGHASPTAEHAAAAAEQWGGRAYTDHETLLDSEEIDAVWVCVPPFAHGDIEQSLIERGIPFFVEKPLAADWKTAETIAAGIAANDIIAGVGYQWRAMDTIPEVRRHLIENPPRMVLGAWHAGLPALDWWRWRDRSGGQMVEQMTHLFDIARALVGEAEVLSAMSTRYDRTSGPDADIANVSSALVKFESGATGVFTATCLLESVAAIHVQLVCEDMMITIKRDGVTYETAAERREVYLNNEPVRAEDRAFLKAVREHDPSHLYSTYTDALRSHRLAVKVRECGITG